MFVGIIIENDLTGNGVGRDSIVPDKCTLLVHETAANITGQIIKSEMFMMLLSTPMKTACGKGPGSSFN